MLYRIGEMDSSPGPIPRELGQFFFFFFKQSWFLSHLSVALAPPARDTPLVFSLK